MAKALWVDTLSIRGMKSINNKPLTVEERAWKADLLWHSPSSSKLNSPKMSRLPRWQIRMSNNEHQNWRMLLEISHLLLTRVVSLGLNGSDLEQMSDKKDGRLPIELVDIWNESFVYSIV